jgi:hypothetical protein
LTQLKARLQALRLARSAVRWGCALSQIALVLIAAWAATWLLDRNLLLSWSSRAVVLVGWLVGVGWFIAQQVRTQWLAAEGIEDLALVVERRQRIENDLIAALQFDAVPAGTWGSPRLSAAVVERVADLTPRLNVFDGFTWSPLPARLTAALAALFAAVALVVLFPHDAAAFWNRFWLGTAHYPTRTVIARLTINEQTVPVYAAQTVTLRVPQGESLQIRADCEGELPSDGRVDVRGLRSGGRASWRMKAAPSSSLYSTEPQSLVEAVRLRVRLGDAVADLVEIDLVPLPVVELHWTVTPPAYAPSSEDLAIADGARQLAVLAGSRLELRVVCLNKRLKSAQLIVPQGEFALREHDAVWTLASGSPFENIVEPLAFEIAAVDEDGLSPQPAITGQIRLRPDRAPRVAAAVVTKKVLPTAKPRISYAAIDDFAVAKVLLSLEITSTQGESRQEERSVWSKPATGPAQMTVRGDTVLDFAPLQLAKGDRVQVTLLAEDERGVAQGQRGSSEPIVFDVTDRTGILSGLLEADQQSARQLDAIILRELGIGGERP